MRSGRFLAGAGLLAFSMGVFADGAADAQAHFKAVAAGDVDRIVSAYTDGARLEWIGGPLNGTYTGAAKIREVWGKFTKANGPLELSTGSIEESANPSGSTVTANVELKGKNTIKVRYVLTYRDGKLANEIWQIDPKLKVAGY